MKYDIKKTKNKKISTSRTDYKILISILAFCISVLSLILSFTNRNETIDVSNVGRDIAIVDGLQSYNDEVFQIFADNSKYFISSIKQTMGEDYLLNNEENIRLIYYKKCIHDLVNSSDYDFFERNNLKEEYLLTLSIIDVHDVLEFPQFLFSSNFQNLTKYDYDKLSKYHFTNNINELYIPFDKLNNKLQERLKKTKDSLSENYKNMLMNNIVNIDIAKKYYENRKNNFGYTKIQTDFFESIQPSERMSFSEGLLLENFDYVITKVVVDNLLKK